MPILILLLYIILNPLCSDDDKKQRLRLLCTCRFYFAVIHLQFFDIRYTLQEPLQCRIWECTSSNTVRGSVQYEYRMFEISLGWKCKSSGMKCHVGGWVVARVAKDHCLHLQSHNWSNLKMKAQWSVEILGAAHPVTQCYIPEDWCLSNAIVRISSCNSFELFPSQNFRPYSLFQNHVVIQWYLG